MYVLILSYLILHFYYFIIIIISSFLYLSWLMTSELWAARK